MILLIDNYDSFTYNLYQYIGSFEPNIVVLRNDEVNINKVYELKPDKIVISPGPKTPSEAGYCIEIIIEFGGKIPILGICLGHQAIGQAYGATVSNAKELFHGKASLIKHNGCGLFKGLSNPMQVARYHSLSIIKETVPDCLEITATTEDGEIMAVKHKQYEVTGLQFHPESIYTPEGMKLIENFVKG
jgi:anthranilate synthase component 2